MKNDFSDEDIIELLRKGDDMLLKWLYEKFGPRIIGLVMSRGGSYEQGQQVLQDAIITVWENVVRGKYKRSGRFESYLLKIAHNKWLERIRKIRNRKIDLLDDNKDDIVDDSPQGLELQKSRVILKINF